MEQRRQRREKAKANLVKTSEEYGRLQEVYRKIRDKLKKAREEYEDALATFTEEYDDL